MADQLTLGWDASDFDWPRGPMDLAAAYAAGVRFFTHKATEGTKTTHKRYGQGLTRARDAGVPVLGAYGVPRTPGNGGHGTVKDQVDYFLRYLDAQTPWWREFPYWMMQCDLEHWPYDKVAPSVGLEWCQRVRDRSGKRVVLYAPRWAYGDSIGGDWPLWASDYGSNTVGPLKDLAPPPTSSRWRAYSGRRPAILQFGSKVIIGRQPGADGNAFRGSLDDLKAFVGGSPGGDDDMTPEQANMLLNVYNAIFKGGASMGEPSQVKVNDYSNGNALVDLLQGIRGDLRTLRDEVDAIKAGGKVGVDLEMDDQAVAGLLGPVVRAELAKLRLVAEEAGA